jgi:hypothetical protein
MTTVNAVLAYPCSADSAIFSLSANFIMNASFKKSGCDRKPMPTAALQIL